MPMTAKTSQLITKVLRDTGYAKYINPTLTKVDVRGREITTVNIRWG
jgi:hypothetical protein